MPRKNEKVMKGAFFILAAATAYACMGTVVKLSGKELSDEQLVFFRNFICLLFLLPWIFFQKSQKETSLKTRVFGQHLVRGISGLLNMYCFFISLRFILLADAMVLNNTMPLFVPLVIWIWKGRKISLLLLPGLIIGFLGVILVLRPGASIFQPAALLALASGIFMSVSMAGIRELSKTDPIYRILFYYFAISTTISFFPVLWSWNEVSLNSALLLFGVGFFAFIYQIFLTKGFQCAPATKISPLIYFAVILSGLFDWIFWDKIPTMMSYIGIILVVIGAIYCMRTEGQKV